MVAIDFVPRELSNATSTNGSLIERLLLWRAAGEPAGQIQRSAGQIQR